MLSGCVFGASRCCLVVFLEQVDIDWLGFGSGMC